MGHDCSRQHLEGPLGPASVHLSPNPTAGYDLPGYPVYTLDPCCSWALGVPRGW